MAKEMKNKKRSQERLLKNRGKAVMAALELGFTSRSEICKAANITLYDLSNLFKADRDLFAEYSVRKRTLVDQATDNIQAIVEDKDHPQHYQASKYVLDNFKSEFDEVLESKEGTELQVELGEESNSGKRVRIVFGNTDKSE